MKKIFLVVILVFTAFSVSAFDWIAADFWAEIGYADGWFGNWEAEPYYSMHYDPIFNGYTELGITVWLIEHIYVSSAITTMIDSESMTNFRPYFSNYMFEAGLNFGPLTFFYSHDCTHPQNTYFFHHRVTSLWGEGGINRAGIRLEFSTRKDN